MKILHLIYDHISNPWVGGGGAVRAYEVYRRIARKHLVTVVCGKYPGAKDYKEGNLSFRFVGTERNNYTLSTFCYAARASSFLRRNSLDPDVVVEDFAPYNPVFSFWWRKDAVIQVHQKEGVKHFRKYAVFGILFMAIESIYHLGFRNAITISQMSKEKFRLRGNVCVIPNGFDPDLLNARGDEKEYLLFLGRLHIHQKGLDTLSETIPSIFSRLIIAGGGKDEQRVRGMFKRFISEGLAEMTGYVSGEKKKDLLKHCRFLVIPSRYEGQPLTLMEAAACSKPVIVSDIPELRYAVDAGFGISFRTGDARDLASKINLLLGNESMRKEMGQRAREYAEKHTWDSIAGEYEAFLVSIVRTT